MDRICILRTVLILASLHCMDAQYFDILQSLQPYIQGQPSQPFNLFNDVTTRRPRPKQKLSNTANISDGNIRKVTSHIDQTDKTRKQITNSPSFDFNAYATTQSAIRKTTRATVTSDNSHRKSENRQDTKFTNTRLIPVTIPKGTNDSRNKNSGIISFDDNSGYVPNNTRGTTKNGDSKETFIASNQERQKSGVSRINSKKNPSQALIAANVGMDNAYDGRNSVSYHTTRSPYFETTKYVQNTQNRGTKSDYYTTHNPLTKRPGVKPAVINGPPITNRPATQRSVTQGLVTQRPVTQRSVTQRPVTQTPATQRPEPSRESIPNDNNVMPDIISGPDEDNMSDVERKRHIDIAEKMCDKYKSLSIKKLQAIPLLPSPEPLEISVPTCTPISVPLVVGGNVVSIQDFPHMTLLGWKRTKNRGYSWKCGGSLLSNQFVLTAGHCAYQDRDDNVLGGPPRVVQLGSSYLNDPKAVIRKIITVIRHPKYKIPKAYYDLAVIKLSSTVTFSEMIKPACLGVPPSAGEPIIATGWGRTEFGGSQSQELRSVSIPVWDINDCYNALGVSIKIPYGPSADSQICAGEKNGGKDTCQGDSGGPVQVQDGCTWRVVAVTSVGRSCGAAETPAIYATVQRAFISAVVFGNQVAQNNNNRSSYQQTTNNNAGSNQGTEIDNSYSSYNSNQQNANNNNNRGSYQQTANNNRGSNQQTANSNRGNNQRPVNNNNSYSNQQTVNNNNRGSNQQTAGNDNRSDNWNSKNNQQRSSTNNEQQTNNYKRENSEWFKQSAIITNAGRSADDSYENREKSNYWDNPRVNRENNGQNNQQQIKNEYSNNNYNARTTERHSNSNSRRQSNEYNPYPVGVISNQNSNSRRDPYPIEETSNGNSNSKRDPYAIGETLNGNFNSRRDLYPIEETSNGNSNSRRDQYSVTELSNENSYSRREHSAYPVRGAANGEDYNNYDHRGISHSDGRSGTSHDGDGGLWWT